MMAAFLVNFFKDKLELQNIHFTCKTYILHSQNKLPVWVDDSLMAGMELYMIKRMQKNHPPSNLNVEIYISTLT